MKLYLVVGKTGEHDDYENDYETWNVKAYNYKPKAESFINVANSLSANLTAIYNTIIKLLDIFNKEYNKNFPIKGNWEERRKLSEERNNEYMKTWRKLDEAIENSSIKKLDPKFVFNGTTGTEYYIKEIELTMGP